MASQETLSPSVVQRRRQAPVIAVDQADIDKLTRVLGSVRTTAREAAETVKVHR